MRRASLVAAFAAALALAAPVVAQSKPNLTGTWELTSQGPRGERTQTFTLTQDGAKLTGSTQLRDNTVAISDGKVDGSSFTFTVSFGSGDRTFTQTYKGTVKGDTVEGTISGGRGDTPFKGMRKAT